MQAVTADTAIGGSFRFLLALILLASLGSSGCSGLLEPALPNTAAFDPWSILDEDLATQRLYRMTYQGPEGEVGFRLTLYLWDRQVYSMKASDPLGRKLWGLSVDRENRALWLDHREKQYCSVAGASTLGIVPLANFPLSALPRLILGVLPVDPGGEVADDGLHLSFRDATGRNWSAGREGGRLAWWSLSPRDEPTVWWRARDRGGIFSDRRGQQQLIWKQVAREELSSVPLVSTLPKGYAEGPCPQAAGAADEPAPGADPN